MSEQEILDRIYSRWPIPHGLTRALPLETHRYYLAHAAGAQWAVLRLKDEAGALEWRTREWRLFGTVPTITECTLQVLGLIESILTMGPDEWRFADVWALIGPEIRLVATGWGELPPAEAVPLWQLAPDDRYDIPINQFRNNSREYHTFLDSPLLRIAASGR